MKTLQVLFTAVLLMFATGKIEAQNSDTNEYVGYYSYEYLIKQPKTVVKTIDEIVQGLLPISILIENPSAPFTEPSKKIRATVVPIEPDDAEYHWLNRNNADWDFLQLSCPYCEKCMMVSDSAAFNIHVDNQKSISGEAYTYSHFTPDLLILVQLTPKKLNFSRRVPGVRHKDFPSFFEEKIPARKQVKFTYQEILQGEFSINLLRPLKQGCQYAFIYTGFDINQYAIMYAFGVKRNSPK